MHQAKTKIWQERRKRERRNLKKEWGGGMGGKSMRNGIQGRIVHPKPTCDTVSNTILNTETARPFDAGLSRVCNTKTVSTVF